MSTPTGGSSTPVVNPAHENKPVYSGDAKKDAEARAAKAALSNETASTSILTSGTGVLDDTNTKKNLLG